jgi:hypothetical protein
MLTCANCGKEEPEGSRFCGSCGAPFASAESQRTESMESPTPAVAAGPAGAEAPTEFAQPQVSPRAPPSGPATPSAAARPAGPRRRVWPFVLIAALVPIIAAGALFATGVIGGGSSVKSKTAFVLQVNENALGPLGRADETAAEHASTAYGAPARSADGSRIVRIADEASAYLGALSGLSQEQKGQVQVLLAFVAANRRYGETLAAFAPTSDEAQPALDGAAAAARAVIAAAGSLPADLQLPSRTAFVSSRSVSALPQESVPAATQPAPDVAVVYVQQVDGLLRESHAVVLALNSFVSRAASDAISRSEAVALARSFANKRRSELVQTRALIVPATFAPAHGLLLRALQASLADDEALLAWTLARRDGSGDAQAAFDRANRIGAHATVLKRRFLRVYGQQRQAAARLNPRTLPATF